MSSVNRLIRICNCSNGTTQIEYALLASLFAMVLLPGTQFIGNSANETFIIAGNSMANSSPGWSTFLGDGSGPGPVYGSGGDSQGLNNNGRPGLSFDAEGGRTEGTVDANPNDVTPPEGGSEP